MVKFEQRLIVGMVALCCAGTALVSGDAVAYWRFEEGTEGSDAAANWNTVLDSSGKGNHLRPFFPVNAPAYITATPFHRVPQTGEENAFALGFGPDRYLFTWHRSEEGDPKAINSHPFQEWTLEASFKPYPVNGYQAIVAKGGTVAPQAGPFLYLRKLVRSGRLELGLVDGAGDFRNIRSLAPLQSDQWHHIAATATASEMSLWVKGPGDSGYEWQGTTPISGAFYNGSDGRGHTATWHIGRAVAEGHAGENLSGAVDEVRISDSALDPSEFLGATKTRPADLEARAVRVSRMENGETRDHLGLEAWAPEPWEELLLESSPDLVDWRESLIATENIRVRGQTREKRRLVSDVKMDDHARHFLRSKVTPSPPDPGEPRNPVFTGADPDSLVVGDTLWVYPTYGYKKFYAFSTTDLVNWEMHGPILRFSDVPWVAEEREGQGSHAWAPGVTEKGGKFYLYYSIGPKPSHIGAAVADSPAGPFFDSGAPLLADNNVPTFEAIDAAAFTDPASGKSYFYAGGSAGATLRVYELNEDMVSFARQISVATPRQFTEGPFMHYRDGIYYLSYSRGYWRDHTYSVHYSTAPAPTGPWNYGGKILDSNSKHKGPGHHSVFRKGDTDEWFIVYHRWNDREGPGPYDGSREVAIDRLEYFPDGRIKPVVMTDTGVGPMKLSGK